MPSVEAQREANLSEAERRTAAERQRSARQLERERVMRLPPEELQALIDSGAIADLFTDEDL